MAATSLERTLNDAIKSSLKLEWTIHGGLTPALDRIEKNKRYLLILKLENVSGLVF